MKVGLCQFASPSDIADSVASHAREAARAADEGCELVLFPELSVTGYQPGLAEERALVLSSPVLDPLSRLSAERSITIGAGVPLRAPRGIEIGLIVFRPDGSRADYAKQLLHGDEEPFFVPGDRCLDLTIAGHTIAFGICYEAMQPAHREAAVERGATLYAASVAKHASGMAEARRELAAFAAHRRVPVVLVNGVGESGGFVSSGASAAWDASGALIAELGPEAGVLVVDV